MSRAIIAAAFVAASTAFTSLAPAPAEAQVARYYDHTAGRWIPADSRRAQAAQMMKRPDKRFERQSVRISTEEKPGTIIVDSGRKFLYFVEEGGTATRYGVGVGKEGFSWGGTMTVGRKAEWPGWTPPAAMREREAAKGRILPAYMEGGPANPLGARALYLYRGGADSLFRIHGTNQPWTIGQDMSSGCIRMMNEDVEHLYERAGRGTKVVVIAPGGQGREDIYAETGRARGGNIFSGLFGG